MKIVVGNLSDADVVTLLAEHLDDMTEHSPADYTHTLDLDALRTADISFWTARDAGDLLGCCALKQLDGSDAEVKSMRTSRSHLRKGIAATMLQHLVSEARRRGLRRLYIETGSGAAFDPALGLYEKHGFRYCNAFGDYEDNSFSRFMCLQL